ncbi:TIGR04255 family protein [Acetomicrobium sp.]|uniref:TIGR04255 family protein n=1 Tax=Acetomicrobium sp. TaxID=1872099 RepID=UPI002FC69BA1
MARKILKNKPLVEAIFEVRWELQEAMQQMRIDPHYKILIGRIYDRVKDEYPFYEQLPTAIVPDEIAVYVVQHRFRKGKDQWPLIQIGPGIITLNDTEGYVWEDFEKRIHHIVSVLFEAYPDAENNLKINWSLLRYIDAINFNYENENIFSFLQENLKVSIEVYEKLFEETGVSNLPLDFDLRFSFPSVKPKGAVHLRFVKGKKKDEDALIWETQVQSIDCDAPSHKNQIIDWVAEAHQLTDDWFFKMIDGELLRRFE